MDSASKSMLRFALVGLLIAGSVIALFQATNVIAKEGTVSVYFSSIASDIQIDTIISSAPAQGNPVGPVVVSLSVTIDSVSVHNEGAAEETGWTQISSTSFTMDITKPTDVTVLIAKGNIPQQNITMVRLHVANAVAAIRNGEEISMKPVVVPSGELKIPLGSARVRAQSNTSIIAERPHIIIQGNETVRLTPVLHVDKISGPE